MTVFVIKEYGRGVSIYLSTCIICCDGPTDGVAFAAKCKKSRVTWRIMNAFQFSTMHTIIDAFPGIWSKVAIECAQYGC